MRKRSYRSNGSVTDSYGIGWEMFTSNFWILTGAAFIYSLIEGITEIEDKEGSVALLSMLFGLLISAPIGMSFSWMFLKCARREHFTLSDMFAVFGRNYWQAVGGHIVRSILTVVGFLLLIIPGIIVTVRLSFMDYLIIDRKMGAIEAMKESWEMTRGHGWTIFFMGLMAIPIILLGLLCFIIGVVAAMALIKSAYAILYHTIAHSYFRAASIDTEFQTLE